MNTSVRPRTGLVIGKFYPPHRGHLELFFFGAAQVETLFIIVCHSERYSIPGELRKAWIEKLAPPNARVILVDERHGDQDSESWARRTVEVLGFAPEKVFTSEDYGAGYCAHLGSEHVPFDPSRGLWPVSGSAIRNDPWGLWEYLPPPVRGY